ncbi:MAG: hypothetical protein KDJ36_17935, partial [Hyphomicrobiaceae bacterium]|nr:hypothetical protein [Hyphomicrobiaceae bacterium]
GRRDASMADRTVAAKITAAGAKKAAAAGRLVAEAIRNLAPKGARLESSGRVIANGTLSVTTSLNFCVARFASRVALHRRQTT